MTLARALAAVLAGLVLSASAATATGARQPTTIARYCSESGDVCFGVLNRAGAVSLEITTVERYFERYALCVDPPRGAGVCRSFPIRTSGSVYGSRIRWHTSFPARGAGGYRVTWKSRATRLGPTLKFRLPLG